MDRLTSVQWLRMKADGFYNVYEQERFTEAADEIEHLREVAVFLFGLLDDIDTTDDVAKGDDKFYRNQIRAIHRRRFEVAETDGYNVKIKTALQQKENNNVSE